MSDKKATEEHSKERPAVGPLRYHDRSIQADVDVRCYRPSAVKKAAYRLADRCTVMLGAIDTNSLPITLLFRPDTTERDALAEVDPGFRTRG